MLNHLQIQILEATFDISFSILVEDCDKDLALKVLDAVTKDTVYNAEKAKFQQGNVLDLVDELRKMYAHPCPQNRAVGSPYIPQPAGQVAWRDATGQVRSEQQGLLSLTQHNNNANAPVTKQDVLSYLNFRIVEVRAELLNNAQRQQQQHPARISTANLLYLMQRIGCLLECLKILTAGMPHIESDAASSYVSSFLNALRKNDKATLENDCELYGIPNQLQDFIKSFLKANTNLETLSSQFPDVVKQLEVSHINKEISQQAPVVLSQAPQTLWQAVLPTNENVNTFRVLMLELVTKLCKHQPHRPAASAFTSVASLLSAMRKKDLAEWNNNPHGYSTTPEVHKWLLQQLHDEPRLFWGKTFPADEVKKIEVILNAAIVLDEVKFKLTESIPEISGLNLNP